VVGVGDGGEAEFSFHDHPPSEDTSSANRGTETRP
jgi:hypothetical protein